MPNNRDTRIVFSTGQGRLCRECARPVAQCKCSRSQQARPAPPAGDGTVRVAREIKGRGGKSVSVVQGLPLAGIALETLATRLKKRCGSGGTVRDGVIEIQGEHRDTLVAELTQLGYRVKRAGG